MKRIAYFLTLLAILAGTALAADCGEGIKTCECGDTLITSYNLSAADPVTYTTCTGNGLIIGSSDITLDCQGLNIKGNEAFGMDMHGIDLQAQTNCTIKNCVVSGFYGGIYLGDSGGNMVRDNTAEGNYIGIYIDRTTGSTIGMNHANDNIYGIVLDESSGNSIRINTANNNMETGIYMYYSERNLLEHNTANNNDAGITLLASNLNDVNGNLAEYNAVGINVIESQDNSIRYNTANNNKARGFYIVDSPGNAVTDNTFCSNNEYSTSFDIVNDSWDTHGSENTCDKSSNWNDDGATGCAYSCVSFVCGNGILEEGEECDGSEHCSGCECIDPYVPDGDGNCVEPTIPVPENTGILALVSIVLIAPALAYIRMRRG